MCFKRKAYNLYSILTIFKPPESFDLYIVNNVTQDDIWHPIYVKFENVLNLLKSRHLSLLEKSIVVNVLVTSKIWYIGSVLHTSKYYISKFQRLIFNFMWNSKSEPLAFINFTFLLTIISCM
jgi:hypothetical protein